MIQYIIYSKRVCLIEKHNLFQSAFISYVDFSIVLFTLCIQLLYSILLFPFLLTFKRKIFSLLKELIAETSGPKH